MYQFLPLDLPAGFVNNGTLYQSKNRWYTGNFVRFFQKTIQPIGGWAVRTLSGATMSGVPRAMVTYRINTGDQVVVIGTTRGLYAIVGSVVHDVTPAAIVANNASRVWQFDTFGSYLVAVDLIAPAEAGAMYVWTGDVSAVATVVQPFTGINPTSALSVVGTPERFLVALGAFDTASGYTTYGADPNDRRVTWATQEGGFTSTDWNASSTNTAGNFTLTTDGSLVCGRRGRGMTLLWTTTDLWGMTYIGGDFVYRFDQLGNKCGIISSHAAVVNDAAAYWMGQKGFYAFDGFVKSILCDVQDYVFNSLNTSYAHLIWAIENPNFGEITWFYPSGAATEIDRYVTYNYREQHWVVGSLQRTCGIALQPGTSAYPVMTNAAASVFDHETGTGRNSEGTPYLESGPIELGDGDRLLALQKLIPDDKTVGDVNCSIYTANYPDESETLNGPYTLTTQTSIRLKARQIRVKLSEAVANAWRVGVVRLGVAPSSFR